MKYWLIVFLLFSTAYGADTFFESLDYTQVVDIKVSQSSNGSWCFDVQIRHNDEGWHHYADAWQIISLQGDVLGERVLYHPHENEQPFTRRVCGVQIPNDVTMIMIRGKCNVHGFGNQSVVVDLRTSKGDKYTVIH